MRVSIIGQELRSMPEKGFFEDWTVEELKGAFRSIFDFSDISDEDIAEMDEILAILQEKDPLPPPPHTVEEMWEQFKAEHAEELKNLANAWKEKDSKV